MLLIIVIVIIIIILIKRNNNIIITCKLNLILNGLPPHKKVLLGLV